MLYSDNGEAKSLSRTVAGVTIVADSAGLIKGAWRDRGDVPHGLGDLIEDSWGLSADGDLRITFSELPPGAYRMTTYHHEALDPPDTSFGGPITVDVGAGEEIAVAGPITVTQTTGMPMTIGSETFRFTATGGDVVVRLKQGTGGRPRINGFEVVPAPAR
jgi:hypothetical protein